MSRKGRRVVISTFNYKSDAVHAARRLKSCGASVRKNRSGLLGMNWDLVVSTGCKLKRKPRKR